MRIDSMRVGSSPTQRVGLLIVVVRTTRVNADDAAAMDWCRQTRSRPAQSIAPAGFVVLGECGSVRSRRCTRWISEVIESNGLGESPMRVLKAAGHRSVSAAASDKFDAIPWMLFFRA